jgi:dipeptidyl aminopeptidase/acylaminoacyl peptidase
LAANGKTQLHGVLFLPADFSEAQRYPLIDFIYPGPQLLHQPQCSGLSLAAPAMALAQLGFATLMLDTRGTPGRDRAFHQAGYPELLQPQLDDHVAVVRELCSAHRFLDENRVGILGHSAGGAASARALFDFPELFKAGVAVCGNHDSTSYTAAWSDKYRGAGTPASWASQANQTVAHKLERPLLLVSGDLDENVHVGQTLSLADALIRANRDFELLIVPNEGHSILMTHGYTQRRIWDFFVRHLLEETPPRHFELRFEPHELARYGQRSWNEIRQ